MPDYRGGTADAPVAFDRPTCDHRIGSGYFDVSLDCSLATNFRCGLGECAHQLQEVFDGIASCSGYRSIGNDVCPVFRWITRMSVAFSHARIDPTAPPPGPQLTVVGAVRCQLAADHRGVSGGCLPVASGANPLKACENHRKNGVLNWCASAWSKAFTIERRMPGERRFASLAMHGRQRRNIRCR
jgi:hypothetical protein